MAIQSENIEINEKFKEALDLLEKTSKNVLITGKAGTGKSTLLDYFVNHTRKDVVVLAPTGVAAVNVNGQTIHSFFGFNPGITIDKIKKAYGPNYEIYQLIDTIIIDEVSMVRADLLDCVDKFLRLNGKNKNKPFGDVQMVFIGDLYQLPPVVKGAEKEVFKTHYNSPYFFDAHAFKNFSLEFIELEKIYRQSDEKFIQLLNAIRNKSISDEELQKINERLNPNFEPPTDDFFIYLTTTNNLSDEINKKELGKLNSKEYVLKGKIKGKFDDSYLPTEKVLSVKEGSQIMLLNNDISSRWVNGTVGKIIQIKEDEKRNPIIKVKLENGKIENVKKHKWDVARVVYNKDTKKIESEAIGSFIQYPLRLAWSVTIHKGQGKTFKKVIIDIGNGTFTHGQAYVALSRCTSLQGIVLKKPIEKKHIWMDWKVVKFLTQFQYNISENKLSLDDKIKRIKEAIKSKSPINIIYLKSNDQKSKRKILPKKVEEMEYMGKTFMGVQAYCYKRNEDRTFTVNRILEMENLK